MKNLTAKYLSLLMLASLLGGNAQATHDGYVRDGYMNGDNCCRTYECGCNPLYCGAWDLQVQAGVAPIIWRNRGEIFGVDCFLDVPVFDFFAVPKFSKLFKVPWTVGGQVGYHWSDNARLYLEFNYVQARGKDFSIATVFTPAGPTLLNQRKYKLFDGYVGVRYYWDRWCDHASFFFGIKVGFTHHKRIRSTITIPVVQASPVVLTDTETFKRTTVVSGGANFGLDYCVCGNWSIVLTGEVVASCGPRGVANIPTPANILGTSSLFFGGIGTELRFPVTLGVRYSF